MKGTKFKDDDAGAMEFLKSANGTAWAKKIIESLMPGQKISILNEYDKESKNVKDSKFWSGPHMHVEIGDAVNNDNLEDSGARVDPSVKRKFGSLGATGQLFENFGAGTPMIAHDLETIMTPQQLKTVVTESQERVANSIVQKINTSDTGTLKLVLDKLDQIYSVLEVSNRYHREVAKNA